MTRPPHPLPSTGSRAGPCVPQQEAQRALAELRDALDRYADMEARRVLERLFGTYAPLVVVRDVLLPYLHEVGDRWQHGEIGVAQEHFAATFLQSRFLALTRGWDRGRGPRALLSCAPGEQHTFGLVAFGLALHRVGWRITYLGADMPAAALHEAAVALEPQLVVVSATLPGRLEPCVPVLARMAARTRCAIGGPGAGAEAASRAGAEHLTGDAIDSAAGFAA